MTPEEETKMMNEDHEIWKRSQELARRACDNRSILKVPGFDIDSQLDTAIQTFKAIARMSNYYRTPFAFTAPLYLQPGGNDNIYLCTTDRNLAQKWTDEINVRLQKSREAAIEYYRNNSSSEEEFESNLNGLFSARCVIMSIDKHISECDPEISSMNYIGVVISWWKSERDLIYDKAKECECLYNATEEL